MTGSPNLQTISQQIRTAVEAHIEEDPSERNLTRVAADIGIHPDTLIRYMEGKSKKGPTYRDVVTIARITGKPIDWFVGEKEAVA
jgi:transcriptional regulator with XRE-family HTH domain